MVIQRTQQPFKRVKETYWLKSVYIEKSYDRMLRNVILNEMCFGIFFVIYLLGRKNYVPYLYHHLFCTCTAILLWHNIIQVAVLWLNKKKFIMTKIVIHHVPLLPNRITIKYTKWTWGAIRGLSCLLCSYDIHYGYVCLCMKQQQKPMLRYCYILSYPIITPNPFSVSICICLTIDVTWLLLLMVKQLQILV